MAGGPGTPAGSAAARPAHSVVVFVKAPVAGTVKTRLGPRIAPAAAAALYTAFARDTLEALGRLAGVRLDIAYQPHPQAPEPSWCAAEVPYFIQQGPDLGARMAHAAGIAFTRGARRVVILGTDSPGLPPDRVRQAFDALDGADLVLGPSTDGGYYLAGLSRPCPGVFDGVAWSSPAVLEQTAANAAAAGRRLVRLPPYFDIDTFADLRRLWLERGRWGIAQAAPRTERALQDLFAPARATPARAADCNLPRAPGIF